VPTPPSGLVTTSTTGSPLLKPADVLGVTVIHAVPAVASTELVTIEMPGVVDVNVDPETKPVPDTRR